MKPAVVLVTCLLSVLLPLARGSEPLGAAVVNVSVMVARDLVQSGGHRYLDIRTEEEFRKWHVVNSLNVPYYLIFSPSEKEKNPNFIEQVKANFEKQDSIVVGCKLGIRSQLACADLMGFKNEKNMEGGITEWVEKGFAVNKPEMHEEL